MLQVACLNNQQPISSLKVDDMAVSRATDFERLWVMCMSRIHCPFFNLSVGPCGQVHVSLREQPIRREAQNIKH